MRELRDDELELVAGGDGIKLPGNNYISGTRVIFNAQGIAGALSLGWTVGYGIGTAANWAMETYLGGNPGDWLYGVMNS